MRLPDKQLRLMKKFLNKDNILILDVDGVLLLNNVKFGHRLCERYGLDLVQTAEFFNKENKNCLTGQADFRKVFPKYIQKWGITESIDKLMTFWLKGECNTNDVLPKFLGILEVDKYIATNQCNYRMHYLWDNILEKKMFKGYFASCDLGYIKPDIRFFKAIKAALNSDGSNLIYVDDKVENITAAKKENYKLSDMRI